MAQKKFLRICANLCNLWSTDRPPPERIPYIYKIAARDKAGNLGAFAKTDPVVVPSPPPPSLPQPIPPASNLAITTQSQLPAATMGLEYAHLFQAVGGQAPYSWDLDSGTLPVGLTLSQSTGLLSGTPTAAATFAFNVKVTAGASAKDPMFTLLVSPTPSNLRIGSPYSVENEFVQLPTTMRGTGYSTTFYDPRAFTPSQGDRRSPEPRWPRRESNPHGPLRGLGILSPVRLPVPPLGRDVSEQSTAP